jgi:broad specificity phosphatase PhoE
MTRRLAVIVLTTMLAALSVPTAARSSAMPGNEITLTFIRHGQSTGNTSGFIDTTTPGPGLTDLGREQARQVAVDFGDAGIDGIFASTMIRTQQTAQPLADRLHEPVVVLPGMQEIEAGVYEGRPNSEGAGFFDVLKQWAEGNRDARIRGSIDGNEFNTRFNDAVAAIYATGDQHPVAFSHGGAIAVWALMNAANADPALLESQPLNNTGYVVVHGSPTVGWTLVDWNGKKF